MATKQLMEAHSLPLHIPMHRHCNAILFLRQLRNEKHVFRQRYPAAQHLITHISGPFHKRRQRASRQVLYGVHNCIEESELPILEEFCEAVPIDELVVLLKTLRVSMRRPLVRFTARGGLGGSTLLQDAVAESLKDVSIAMQDRPAAQHPIASRGGRTDTTTASSSSNSSTSTAMASVPVRSSRHGAVDVSISASGQSSGQPVSNSSSSGRKPSQTSTTSRTSTSASASGGNRSKSGEIYRLLLESEEGGGSTAVATEYHYTEPRPATASTTTSNRVPGKVPKDRVQRGQPSQAQQQQLTTTDGVIKPSTAATSSSSSTSSSQKRPVEEPSPRSARGVSLLAQAKPSQSLSAHDAHANDTAQ